LPSVGPTELILVFLIALVVLGPKRLPEVGRQVGRALREFRSASSQLRSELGVDEIIDEVNAVRADVGVDELGRDLKQDAHEVSTAFDVDLSGRAPATGDEPMTGAPPASPGEPGAG
jgi:TatA/E family protein of Tat protein translocase